VKLIRNIILAGEIMRGKYNSFHFQNQVGITCLN